MQEQAIFHDRSHAGRILARRMRELSALTVGEVGEHYRDPVVLAMPRGGVPVAVQVADALSAQLDVVLVRKLGSPDNPEYAFGSVAEEGISVIDQSTVNFLGLANDEVERIREQQAEELKRRLVSYRKGREPIPLQGRNGVGCPITSGATELKSTDLRRRG